MRKLILSIFFLVLISCNPQEKQFSKDALSIKLLTTKNNSEISFSDILKKHQGKNILIEVWASWCGDCVKAMPFIKNLQKKYQNIDYIFLSMDKTPEKWLTGIEIHNLKGDHFMVKDGMNSAFGNELNVSWIPRYIIVDKFGKVILYKATEKNFNKIEKMLNKLN